MRAAGAQTQAERASGFTLIELLVVLVVMAFVAAIALTQTRKQSSAAALQTATTRLAAGLRNARTDAMRTNRAQSVTVDLAQHRFWLNDPERATVLPPGLEIVSGGRDLEWLDASTARIRFEPDGSSPGALISLRGGGRSAAVVVDWMTGATHVDWNR